MRLGQKKGDSLVVGVLSSVKFKGKGQITSFIIIAIVIALFVGLMLYVINLKFSAQDNINKAVVSELALFPPEKYVTHCVQKKIVEISEFVLSQGGVADIMEVAYSNGATSNSYGGRDIKVTTYKAHPYLFWARDGENTLMSNEFVSLQVNTLLEESLSSCINLSFYAEQGYKIREEGAPRTNVSIYRDSVHVLVYYPFSLQKGDVKIDRTTFAADVDLPVGRLLEYGREIVNAHMRAPLGEVEIDTLSIVHQKENVWLSRPMVEIEKSAVYPHILYSLNLDYKGIRFPLRFAVEGEDKFSSDLAVAQGLGSLRAYNAASSCNIGERCYVGVSYDLCTSSDAEYVFGEGCNSKYSYSGIQNAIEGAASKIIDIPSFSSCTLDNGTKMASGSSWCELTSDSNNFIGVGSRSSRNLCVNGKIIQEACQDYRTEVCADSVVEVRNDATLFFVSQCRLNTASTCLTCTDKSCCEKQDCIFEVSSTGNLCVPKVPLGLPFWKPNIQLCAQSYSNALAALDASSTSGVMPSAQSLSRICSLQADCGATLSVTGEPSLLQDATYYSKLAKYWQSQKSIFMSNVPISKQGDEESVGELESNAQTISLSTILSNRLAEIETLVAFDSSEYLNPNISIPQTQLSDSFSGAPVCQPYVASAASTCEYCDTFGNACSEYVCRSLGAACRAFSNTTSPSGVSCIDVSSLNDFSGSPLNVIKVISSSGANLLATTLIGTSDEGVSAQKSESGSLPVLRGFLYPDVLLARQLLDINFTTNRPALCKPTYLPYLSYLDVDSLDLSSGEYSLDHQIKLRFVNDLPVFDKMLTSFAVPNFEQLLDALLSFKTRIDQLRKKYGFIAKYNPSFYPYLDDVVSQYLNDRTRPILISLLNKITDKQFFVFIVCQDEFGNQLDSTPFVEVQLKSNCQETAPEVVKVVTDSQPYIQSSLTLYLDKVGSCKFDSQSVPYDQMRYNMTCALSEYDFSAAYDGTYACVARVANKPEFKDANALFYSCIDKIENTLAQRKLSFTFAEDSEVSRISSLNLSTNLTFTSGFIGENLTLSGINGYRCSVTKKSEIAAAEELNVTMSCTTSNCVIKNRKLLSSIGLDIEVTCNPRMPAQSCNLANTYVGDIETIELSRVPTLRTESVEVVQSEIVVITNSRGNDIFCTLINSQGSKYNLIRKTNTIFTMPSSFVDDRTLVSVTCSDKYGSSAKYIGLLKK